MAFIVDSSVLNSSKSFFGSGNEIFPSYFVIPHKRLTSSGSPILWLDQVLSHMV
jgi:hypothetical protein